SQTPRGHVSRRLPDEVVGWAGGMLEQIHASLRTTLLHQTVCPKVNMCNNISGLHPYSQSPAAHNPCNVPRLLKSHHGLDRWSLGDLIVDYLRNWSD
ncbi:hypothetical protein FRC16_003226, partial [Serendipita sp. 398]